MSNRRGKKSWVLFFLLYFVFLSIIPITYGFYVYDLRIVPIIDPKIRAELEAGVPTGEGKEIWFLGEFGNKYVFSRKVGNPIESMGIIETRNISDLKRLSFDIRRASILRIHMTNEVPQQLKKEQKEETMKLMLKDLAKQEVKK